MEAATLSLSTWREFLTDPWTIGVLVAAVQLCIVYFFADPVIRHFKNKLWKDGRLEFNANLLNFARSASRPMAHYIKEQDGIALPRENIESALTYLQELSRNFDSFLTIYTSGIPADWLAELSRIADDFRRIAGHASSAERSWEKIEAKLPFKNADDLTGAEKEVYTVRGFRRINSIASELPEDHEQRSRVRFASYIIHCCDDLVIVTEELQEFAKEKYALNALNKSSLYQKINNKSKGDVDACTDDKDISEDRTHLQRVANMIEKNGICLVKQKEGDKAD